MLVGAFEVQHLVLAAVAQAVDAGEAGELLRILQRKGVGRAGIEPDIENVVDLGPAFGGALPQKSLARTLGVPGVGALRREGVCDARVDGGIDQRLVLRIDEDRDRHAPGALARDDPVRPVGDHPGDPILARRRHPARARDLLQRDAAQGGLVGAYLLPLAGEGGPAKQGRMRA